jgi:hypothetical protein
MLLRQRRIRGATPEEFFVASKEAPLAAFEPATWTGVKGKTYTGTVLRVAGDAISVLTDTTQNVMSFTKASAKAAGLRRINV